MQGPGVSTLLGRVPDSVSDDPHPQTLNLTSFFFSLFPLLSKIGLDFFYLFLYLLFTSLKPERGGLNTQAASFWGTGFYSRGEKTW